MAWKVTFIGGGTTVADGRKRRVLHKKSLHAEPFQEPFAFQGRLYDKKTSRAPALQQVPQAVFSF
jgi:hypothetical protein